MEKEYKVVGPHLVAGHSTDEKFKAEFHPELELALVNGGHIKVLSKPEPLKCEACQAHGNQKEKRATFKDLLDLREHYGKEHPALAAPTE